MVSSQFWVRTWVIVGLLVGGWSGGASAATKTWTGAINALWSTSGNWAGGTPVAGDRIAFPVSASNLTNTNDLTAGTVFFDITFLGSNYIINGNTIGLSDGIPGNNGSNNRINADLQLTAPQTLQGAFCCAGLTLGNIDIGANATTIAGATVLGVISGTGPVTMGDVTNFTGNNTYSGLTTVSGRGQVDGSQPGSDVQLTASFIARLSGDGTVGSVTTASQSIVTPGAGLGGVPGKLTTNNLAFGNSSSYEVQLNGPVAGTSYDQVAANGSVTIGSSVNLSLALNYSPSTGQVLTLIDNDGVDPVTGFFNGMPEGTTVTMNASDFQISYVGGSGNDVVLTVTAAAKTWTGAVNNLWSVAGNWQGGVPGAGDPLVFPNGASNISNTNDLPAATVYKLMLFTGSNYIIGGNTIGLSNGIPASNGTNNRVNADLQLTAPQTLQGAFCCAGLTLAGNIDIGANATTIAGATVLGVISGTGTMTMGDVTNFTGNNTYSGLTTVSGRGQVDGSQPGSDVQLTASFIARLSGDGTVGSVTTASQSIVTPGAGLGGVPGKLTTNNLAFGNSSSYEVQLNGPVAGTSYDQVAANGTVTIGSSVNLSLALNYSPSTGQVLTLIDNDGVDPVTGFFNGMPEGTTVTMNASDFQISYVGGSGNDVVLTVTAAAKTWTGAVNNLWSVAGNWQGGVPVAGDPLVFPNGASNLSNTNNLPAATVYKIILFTGSNYIIGGNTIGLSDGIPGNNGSNNRINANLQLTAPQTLQGAFCCAGLTLAGNIDIGANATNITGATVTGVISGTGTMTMGDVTNFTGNNTYSGLTTVSGRGQIDGSQPGSNVQLTASFIARLSGDGTVGTVTTASSSIVTPGGGLGGTPGKLTMGNATFNNNSSYEVQLNGSLPGVGYDQVVVNGTVTLSGNVSLNVSLGFTPSLGQIFVIALNDGTDPVSGTFSGLPQNATFNLGPYPFQISYIGKTGNEIILTSLSGDSLNRAPVAVSDSYAVPQNTSLSINAPGVLTNDSDADLDPITVVQAPSSTEKGGALTLNADGSFLYQPPTGFVGFDHFTYIISDGNDATDLATVTINVQDVDPPIVTVNSPNGGEIIFVGSMTKLDWTIADKKPIIGVDLYISRDNGSTYEKIASNIAHTGTYTWTVTPPGTNTGATPVFSALFKVDARDSSNNVGSDVSDAPFALQDLATATTLAMFQASAVEDGIELRWQLGDSHLFANLTIERSKSQNGPWVEVLLDRRNEGDVTVAFDRTVEPEQTYFYRLMGTSSENQRVLLGLLSGSAHMVIKEFAISRILPNPSRGAIRIDYALPRESRVLLSILDIQGRVVTTLADGMFKAGRYQATWTGQTDRGEAPAGVYFVRCRALGKNLTERLVRTR